MKKLLNNVTVTGKLVKNNLKELQTKNGERAGEDAIGGSLVLRTADDSEHEINFFNYKYKRDENKQLTSELSYFYEKYLDAMLNLKDIEHCDEGEHPDIISITDGIFMPNDFLDRNHGNVVSNNKISAKFINKIEPKDYDSTVLEAKFEVEGVIDSIKDEVVKNVPTGNLVVMVNAIGQRADGFGKDAKYEADYFIPIKMIVDKDMAQAFKSAGYYDTCFAKFVGTIVNTAEVTKIVEKAAFGNDITNEIKHHIRRNEIKSGTQPSTFFEHELTQEIVDAMKAKRKATLAEVKLGVGVGSSNDELPFKPDTSTPAPKTNYNPFAAK